MKIILLIKSQITNIIINQYDKDLQINICDFLASDLPSIPFMNWDRSLNATLKRWHF